MKLENLQPALFLRRYKRFLVDVKLPDGAEITVHCPNTGSMKGCLFPEGPVMLLGSDNPKRKYRYSLEMTQTVGGDWIGVNTWRTNKLVHEAIANGVISEIGTVDSIHPEVRVSEKSRLDFLLEKDNLKIYLEVKNCTLVENAVAMFPDAVTTRGTKHLNELISLQEQGDQAVLFFCIQREDTKQFSPACHIDLIYSETLKKAVNRGVVVLAYQASVNPKEILIKKNIPVLI